MDVIETIPPSNYRKGPRESKCLDLVNRARESPTRKIAVIARDAEQMDELDKLYKSMVQWKARHQDQPVRIRKDRDRLFVWLPEAEPEQVETCELCHQPLPR